MCIRDRWSGNDMPIRDQCGNQLLINRFEFPSAGDGTCKINIHFLLLGKRERIELFRFCWELTDSVPVRILSSSELKRIQSLTTITKCGVVSLKKSGERNNRKTDCDMGWPFNSITSAVILESGWTISACHFEMLWGGNNEPKFAEDLSLIHISEPTRPY